MRPRRTPFFALLTAVALSLSGCTSTAAAGQTRLRSSSGATRVSATPATAAAVYQQMRKSVTAAKSVHIKGVYADKGQKTRLDVAGDRAGMTMRLQVNFGTGLIEVIKVNDAFYLKADAGYWTRLTGSAATARSAADKYVKVPPGSAAGMGDFRVGALLDQVFAEDVSASDELNTKVQTTEVDGVPAYLLTTKVGGDAKLYVSVDGQARLLRAESAKGGTLDFTEWDSVASTSTPPADQMAETPSL